MVDIFGLLGWLQVYSRDGQLLKRNIIVTVRRTPVQTQKKPQVLNLEGHLTVELNRCEPQKYVLAVYLWICLECQYWIHNMKTQAEHRSRQNYFVPQAQTFLHL